ncbi:unnamed protein product, partial [Ectocarpus sp. 12 AP-2014]
QQTAGRARRESERTTIIAQRLLWERCFVVWRGADHLLCFSATLRAPGGSQNRTWRALPHSSATPRTLEGEPQETFGRANPCDRPFVRYWRAAIMSTSGSPSTAAVKADQLRNLAKLVEESRPWYEALGMTAEKASGILGEDAKDYVSEQGSGLGRKTAELLFSAADVD